MLKKLIALDFKTYSRIVKFALAIYALILLSGVALILVKIPFLSGFVQTISFGATFIMIPASLFLGVYHFYVHLYSRQGYLTQTLPVTAGQRYSSKWISSFLVYFLSSIVTVCGLLLLIWADGHFHENVQHYYQIFQGVATSLGVRESVLWIMVFGLWLWVFASFFALYSFCITVGMGRKFAGAGQVGPVIVYIMTYIASQILILLGYMAVPLSLRISQQGSEIGTQIVTELPTNIFKYISFGENQGLADLLQKAGGVFKIGLGYLVVMFVITLVQILVARRQMKEVNLR